MRLHLSVLGILVLTLPLFGCGGGGDDDDAVVETTVYDATVSGGVLRFINAIPDSPTLLFEYLASWDGSGGTESIAFSEGMVLSPIASGFDVTTGYYKPNGEAVVLFEFLQDLGDTDIEVAVDDDVTLLLAGTLADPVYRIIENEEYLYGLALPEDGEVLTVDPEVVFVHAVEDMDPLDYYLTEAPVALTTVAPLATLGYLDDSYPVSLEPRDDYRLRITPVGDPDTVLFDSGEFTLTTNVRVFFPTVEYFGPGTSEIQVVPLGASFEEADLPAALRVANLVADVPSLDFHFGDTSDTPVLGAVAFQTLTAYREEEVQSVNVNVTPEGIDNQFVYQGSHTLSSGSTQTLYITGLLNAGTDDDSEVTGTLVTDDVRPVASEIRVRVVHGAAGPDLLDVHILQPGQVSADVTAVFDALTPGASEVAGFEPGEYDVVVVDRANGAEVYGPERINLVPGSLYALLISESAGGGAPLDVTLADTDVNP